jgi:signal transduction histidine kinase
MAKERLVSREDLEKLIDGIEELAPYREFLKNRWIHMVLWWHSRSIGARWKYFTLRATMVVGGVMIPVLTTLNMLPEWRDKVTIVIAIVGAIVAGAAAWEGVANYGETWREKRRAAELLKVEGWQFLQLCGAYQQDQDYRTAFPRFASAVESMVAKEVGEYLAQFDSSVDQARTAAQELTAAIVDEARRRIAQGARQ